jgi:hypothetical protein
MNPAIVLANETPKLRTRWLVSRSRRSRCYGGPVTLSMSAIAPTAGEKRRPNQSSISIRIITMIHWINGLA